MQRGEGLGKELGKKKKEGESKKIDAVKPQWSHLLYSWITHARGFWLRAQSTILDTALPPKPTVNAPLTTIRNWHMVHGTYLSSDNCIENWIKPSCSQESNGSCLSSGWVSVTVTTSWAMASRGECRVCRFEDNWDWKGYKWISYTQLDWITNDSNKIYIFIWFSAMQ